MSPMNSHAFHDSPRQNGESTKPKHIVGIGASAGGLESLELLFRRVSSQSGMAFIVIQHLSPDFKSMMSELLARDTSMRIEVASDGVRVEANTIYLMPPKKEMIIADGCLHLSDRDMSKALMLPIDHFLESLARECGKTAIAVILSGSGSDGTRGIAEIARHGGLVICESTETAKFDGMPSSAQATGLVDFVLPPGEIGEALVAYSENPQNVPRREVLRHEWELSLKGIDAILHLFRNAYDIDFSFYKSSTVSRRIQRRLAMANISSVDQYAQRLQRDPGELHALYRDLLIGVTEFFRDPEIFHRLCTNILPELVARPESQRGIRAWVAGCATGEEAYSVAIAFHEAMARSGHLVPLKLFATDVHKRSIEQAGRGFYRPESLEQLPSELVQRYFVRRADGYQVIPDIRRQIVFAPHNILRDAPFTDLDFVSCRNLLIYLQPAAQHRAISLFHYGLRVGGLLLLGGSESPGDLAHEFDVMSEKHRLYRKTRDVRLALNLRAPTDTSGVPHLPRLSPSPRIPSAAISHRPRKVYDELLRKFMPPSILIDQSRTVIDTFAGAESLLQLPSRQPSLDILDLVDRDVRTALSGTIMRAMKEDAAVRFANVRLQQSGVQRIFNLTVEPLPDHGEEPCFLISFTPIDTPPPVVDATQQEADELDASRSQIRQLEDDLRYSRENLQATIEELETSNEELQATNEELIASNEELQSTNEELHSLNEELYTVNAEHQRKIDELAELNRDMTHLLENTDVATVFLDRELRIRRFTSKVRQIFELIDEDVGRSIHVFASSLKLDDFMTQLTTVLETGQPCEREVLSRDGTSYLMRLLPYRSRDTVDGIVMMWIDVSSLELLRGRLRWLSAIVESTSDAIIGQDLEGNITSWNRGAEHLYGYTTEEILGKPISLLIPEDRLEELQEYRAPVLDGERILSIDTVRRRKDGTLIEVSLTISPVMNSENQVIGISKIARDISHRIEMERAIRRQVRQRERFLAMLSHELRNPLNAVSTASALLADPRADESQQRAAAASIQRQVRMINHLLADLLDVARIAENRINLKFESLDLRELRRAVEEIAHAELVRHGCTLEYEIPDEPLLVRGDRTRLVQIQVNLIHNAAKYSGSHDPIRVAMTRDGDRIHLSVTDYGKGIPTAELETIFEPFAQLNQSRTHSDGGLGLGLSLAKSLVELHGGRISAESQGEGHGCTFHVWLPLLAETPEQIVGSSAATPSAAKPGDSAPEASCGERPAFESSRPETAAAEQSELESELESVLHIVIVEDMDDNRELIQSLLELDGHRVATASHGERAVDLIRSHQPDIAFIDIGLPDISGYEVARRVRIEAGEKAIRLIALTGYGQPADIEQALKAGFDQHLVKPIDPLRLQQICEEALGDHSKHARSNER